MAVSGLIPKQEKETRPACSIIMMVLVLCVTVTVMARIAIKGAAGLSKPPAAVRSVHNVQRLGPVRKDRPSAGIRTRAMASAPRLVQKSVAADPRTVSHNNAQTKKPLQQRQAPLTVRQPPPPPDQPSVSAEPNGKRTAKHSGTVPVITGESHVHAPFFGSESDLLKACDAAEQSLKVWVYSKPNEINNDVCKSIAQYFHLEFLLPQYLKGRSVVLAESPETADLFLVDHDTVCLSLMRQHRSINLDDYVQRLLRPVIHEYPYFNRSKGRDHMFVYVCDNGAFCTQGGVCSLPRAFLELARNMIMIGNYGWNGTSKFNKLDTKLPCFRSNHDIVLPQYHRFFVPPVDFMLEPRKADSFFKGAVRKAKMIASVDCSPGVRGRLWEAKQSVLDNSYFLWDQTGFVFDAYYGWSPAGLGPWSSRLYDSVFHDVVPVVLAEGIVEPFERFLDWTSFSVKLADAAIVPSQKPRETMDEDGIPIPPEVPPYIERMRNETTRMKEMLASQANNSGFVARLVSDRTADADAAAPTYWPEEKESLARKLLALNRVQRWLSWNDKEYKRRNAWRLLILELWCRTPKASASEHAGICERDSSTIAHQQYW